MSQLEKIDVLDTVLKIQTLHQNLSSEFCKALLGDLPEKVSLRDIFIVKIITSSVKLTPERTEIGKF